MPEAVDIRFLNEEQKERLVRALKAEIPCVPLVRLMCVRAVFAFLVFVEVCAAIIVESTIVPFFRISPFAVSCSTTCEKSFSCSSFFEMAVLFFYSASVCRLLIITIFLPSLQYLFSVFCRRKSGHLPELP